MAPDADPYVTLGVSASASDAEVRRAYRQMVKLHHPDHNGGSPQAAARFAAVHSAYDEVMRRRGTGAGAGQGAGSTGKAPDAGRSAPQSGAGRSAPQSEVDARLAAMERDVAASRRQAPAPVQEPVWQPSREDLGYYDTEDTFTAIIDDAVSEASERWKDSDAKRKFTQRLTDLFGS